MIQGDIKSLLCKNRPSLLNHVLAEYAVYALVNRNQYSLGAHAHKKNSSTSQISQTVVELLRHYYF